MCGNTSEVILVNIIEYFITNANKFYYLFFLLIV